MVHILRGRLCSLLSLSSMAFPAAIAAASTASFLLSVSLRSQFATASATTCRSPETAASKVVANCSVRSILADSFSLDDVLSEMLSPSRGTTTFSVGKVFSLGPHLRGLLIVALHFRRGEGEADHRLLIL